MSDLSVRLSARAEKGLETDLVDVDDVGDESKTRHDGGEGLGQRAPRLIRLFPLSRLLQGRPLRSLASSALPLPLRSVLPPPQPPVCLSVHAEHAARVLLSAPSPFPGRPQRCRVSEPRDIPTTDSSGHVTPHQTPIETRLR